MPAFQDPRPPSTEPPLTSALSLPLVSGSCRDVISSTPAALEARRHKLKRLASPNSFFMDVKCQVRLSEPKTFRLDRRGPGRARATTASAEPVFQRATCVAIGDRRIPNLEADLRPTPLPRTIGVASTSPSSPTARPWCSAAPAPRCSASPPAAGRASRRVAASGARAIKRNELALAELTGGFSFRGRGHRARLRRDVIFRRACARPRKHAAEPSLSGRGTGRE